MALCFIQVGRVASNEYHSFGHFVIDAPYTRQDEILAVLSDNDKSKIGFHLGVTPAWEKLPEDIQFHLSPMAVNPMDRKFPRGSPAGFGQSGAKSSRGFE